MNLNIPCCKKQHLPSINGIDSMDFSKPLPVVKPVTKLYSGMPDSELNAGNTNEVMDYYLSMAG